MQDFWKVPFNFGLFWESDLRGEETDDPMVEIDEFFDEEEDELDLEELDPERRMMGWGFEL